MPPAPEVGEGGGEDGAAEVFRQVNAEHPGNPAGNVDAPGEIAVELDTVEQDPHGEDTAAVGPGIVQNGVHQHGGPVGDDHLFEIAPHHQLDAVLQVGVVRRALGQQLGGQLVKPADGTLDHLGEEGDKQKEFGKVLLRLILVPIDVDDIAHRLEDKIGDTQWEHQFRQGNLAPRAYLVSQRLQKLCGKVPVLEDVE